MRADASFSLDSCYTPPIAIFEGGGVVLVEASREHSEPRSEPRKSIMKMKKVKFYATLRGEGLIAALPHTPSC